MTYEIAQASGASVDYGWLTVQATSGGPADAAGLRGGTQQVLVAGESVTIGGDIIVAINTTYAVMKIRGTDDLSSVLEECTSPNQTINVTIIRSSQTMTLSVTLGTRP